jgi:hypothetical protein
MISDHLVRELIRTTQLQPHSEIVSGDVTSNRRFGRPVMTLTASIAAVFAVVLAVVVISTHVGLDRQTAPRRTSSLIATGGHAKTGRLYPLPHYSPHGRLALSEKSAGALHIAMSSGHACAWLGGTRQSFIWPAGYRVRLHPAELVDADGHTLARSGQSIELAGGEGRSPVGFSCGPQRLGSFYVDPGSR